VFAPRLCGLRTAFVAVVLAAWLAGAGDLLAAACTEPIARFTAATGEVDYRHGEADPWERAMADDALCVASSVRVGQKGRAALRFTNDSTLALDQGTRLRLVRIAPEEDRSFLEMLSGAIHFFSHRPRALDVATPYVNAGTEGTEFLIELAESQARIIAYEGRVQLANAEGALALGAGEAAVAAPGAAPRPVLVARPRDAVAWALHYPPVQNVRAGAAPGTLPAPLAEAARLAEDGDTAGAIALLESIPDDRREVRAEVLRAGLLLDLGRVEAADAALEGALEQDPDAALALAQRSVLRLIQDRRAAARADALRAVELEPDSATALIAKSYVQQADFELDEATHTLQQAVAAEPSNALAHARLAELLLSAGDLDGAIAAAERAEDLAPGLARSQNVLGFAALAAIDVDAAAAAFSRAAAIDAADPLAHLGLGLALIRDGDLAAGRAEIETAASLDPNNALLRSYLGKAYFEERRGPKDAAQFEIAKDLDPLDPTPWFYAAIQKQLENRPVEALRDLESAIARNDNRAVYRSRLLLDQDRASRGVSLARIYDDLGFDQLALNGASRSLADDPANHSAHRFLADAYARLPRHELARSSELLQAQLLQPINVNPVQPSQAFTDLNLVAATGPANAAFNEFHPLFERDRLQATASAFVGDHDTFGDEIVVSGLVDKFAVSAGQYHSETDGFRQNNDVENELYDLFFQAALTPKLNLQAEYRRRETDQGDLFSNFDLDDLAPDNRVSIEQDVFRLGGHYRPAVGSDFLFSLIYADKTDETFEATDFFSNDGETEDEGYQAEAQYQWSTAGSSLVVGGSHYAIDVDQRFIADLGLGFPLIDERRFEREQTRVYGYAGLELLPGLELTLGGGVDHLEDDAFEQNTFTPKAGLRFAVTDWLDLRAAAFKTVKSTLAVQQTIEPTQLAGFNQLFDDFNGTEANSFALGLDARLSRNWSLGGAFWHRDVDEPLFVDIGAGQETVFRGGTENLYQLYAYWTPSARWALTAETRFEQIERNFLDFDVDSPLQIDTFSLPLVARYFAPNGIFIEAGATYRHQEVERSPLAAAAAGEDDVVLVDAALGYRLPKRRGILSLEARNLFDQDFDNQDLNFITSETRASALWPERSLIARLTLNF
jgi:Flp pilus assembly protein TadD